MPQGDLRAAAKRIAAGGRKKPNPRGRQRLLLCPRGRRPFPIPKLAAQTLRTSGPLLRNAQLRVNRNAPAISHPPLLPEAPLRRQGQRTSGQSEVDAFSGRTVRRTAPADQRKCWPCRKNRKNDTENDAGFPVLGPKTVPTSARLALRRGLTADDEPLARERQHLETRVSQ